MPNRMPAENDTTQINAVETQREPGGAMRRQREACERCDRRHVVHGRRDHACHAWLDRSDPAEDPYLAMPSFEQGTLGGRPTTVVFLPLPCVWSMRACEVALALPVAVVTRDL